MRLNTVLCRAENSVAGRHIFGWFSGPGRKINLILGKIKLAPMVLSLPPRGAWTAAG